MLKIDPQKLTKLKGWIHVEDGEIATWDGEEGYVMLMKTPPEHFTNYVQVEFQLRIIEEKEK